MHAPTLRLAAAVAGLALFAGTAAAQSSTASTTRPTFGIAAGLALPTGDFGDAFSSGFNVTGHVGFEPSTVPVGLRLEGMYNRFDLKGAGSVDGNASILGFTGNAILGGTAAPGSIRPYAIGGLGVYNTKVSSDLGDGDSETKFGLNAGAGIDVPLSGIAVFFEARFHYVMTEGSKLTFIPITVGVKF